jgi:hypothetical protein
VDSGGFLSLAFLSFVAIPFAYSHRSAVGLIYSSDSGQSDVIR